MQELRDSADWDGVVLKSINVGAVSKNPGAARRNEQYLYDGYHYCTEGEFQLARLLDTMSIPFTPDVSFHLDIIRRHNRVGRRQFVPDFVFNKLPFIWWSAQRRPLLIHGIEAKRASQGRGEQSFSDRARENVRLLYRQRGIRILLLSNQDIALYAHWGALPLMPLPGKGF
ncbi:hypothetical protein AMJ57_05680 [Parcubacteria bacterium SG8_24]|nr:MAG: hypothetical protein AMJ57_05680 [Parcubacteria bacterium SG8_24]